jgi:hypothetical protein
MKNSNDTVMNRTRDFPTCSAVLQPTAPPRAPSFVIACIYSVTMYIASVLGLMHLFYYELKPREINLQCWIGRIKKHPVVKQFRSPVFQILCLYHTWKRDWGT